MAAAISRPWITDPGYVSTVIRTLKVVLLGVAATTVAMAAAAAAHADEYIDFGTNQAACKAAAQQANAAGNRPSYCFETGPGHYSLNLDN